MSSKAQRKQAAAILGSAKTAKKAKAARENGFKPKRKRKLTKKIEKMISDEGDRIALRASKDYKKMMENPLMVSPSAKLKRKNKKAVEYFETDERWKPKAI